MANLMNTVAASAGNNYKLDNVVLDVWSKEMYFKAQAILVAMSAFQRKTDLTASPGMTIKFLKFNPVTGTAALTEGTAIETSYMSTTTASITVAEHGKALKMTELLMRASTADVGDAAAELLGRHYATYLDGYLGDVLQGFTNIKYSQAGGAATTRAHLVTGSVFDVPLIRKSVEFMGTNKVPKFEDGYYHCFLHPHQAISLRTDNAWTNIVNYAQPNAPQVGEIGTIENVKFFETTQTPYIPATTQDIWRDGADTGNNTVTAANNATDVYRAVMVGNYACGFAEGLPVEMRDGGNIDFGREHALAWYSIFGAGIIEANHGLILETA